MKAQSHTRVVEAAVKPKNKKTTLSADCAAKVWLVVDARMTIESFGRKSIKSHHLSTLMVVGKTRVVCRYSNYYLTAKFELSTAAQTQTSKTHQTAEQNIWLLQLPRTKDFRARRPSSRCNKSRAPILRMFETFQQSNRPCMVAKKQTLAPQPALV